MGKRIPEDSTSAVTLSAISKRSGSERAVKDDIENVIKAEVKVKFKTEIKTEIETETKVNIDSIVKKEVKEEDLAKAAIHSYFVFPDIKNEVKVEDKANAQGESTTKLERHNPSIAAPKLSVHEADTEERPPKRERLQAPSVAGKQLFPVWRSNSTFSKLELAEPLSSATWIGLRIW